MKNEIKNWFESDQDYNKGLDLLNKHANVGKALLKTLEKGETKNNINALKWELVKISGLNRSFLNLKPAKKAQDTKKYPETDIIKRLKKEISELSNLRAQLHATLIEIPQDNEPENVEKRAEIVDKIASYSNLIDKYYHAKENYFKTGKLPEETIFDSGETSGSGSASGSSSGSGSASGSSSGSGSASGNSKGSQVDIAQLILRRNNLRANISKVKKKFDSAEKKADKITLGNKLTTLTKELESIEMILNAVPTSK